MRHLLPLAALATGLMAASACAQDGVSIMGVGAASCESWTRDQQVGQVRAQQDQQWVLGFLSGIAYAGMKGDNPLDDMDAKGVWAWIENYCQTHPIGTILTAAEAFNDAHSP